MLIFAAAAIPPLLYYAGDCPPLMPLPLA